MQGEHSRVPAAVAAAKLSKQRNASGGAPFRGLLIGTEGHSRNGEFKYVVERLLEKHDDGHLDEEVCQAPAGVTLRGRTKKGLSLVPRSFKLTDCHLFRCCFVVCAAGCSEAWTESSHLLQSPSSNPHIVSRMAIYPVVKNSLHSNQQLSAL